jgi:Thymidine kinase
VVSHVVGRICTMTQIFDPPVEASASRTGSLTVITGSMFSGKTEELIRRIRRALYARRGAQVFKHTIDTRSGNTEIRRRRSVGRRPLPRPYLRAPPHQRPPAPRALEHFSTRPAGRLSALQPL